MGYDEHGRCPLVDAGGRCSIYEDRPRTCRTYDCRVFAAAGTEADNEVITRQARRWRFGYPAQQDRDEHAAVRAAARFVRERGACLPGGVAPRDPVGIALLAIEAYEVFLGPDPRVGGEAGEAAASGACTAADREAASAILAAHERFAARRTDADAAWGG